MINFIISRLKKYAWFKRFNAKITYELLAKYVPAEDWHFMNYGYIPREDETPIHIPDQPNLQKYSLQMYHYLALKAPIEGKEILEVGSGRGGGARHIAKTFKPAAYTGLDLAQSAVDLANRIHKLPNLKFIQGSAEHIPLKDNSVDIVLNVESSHAYGSVEMFLKEVRRVLRTGGYFLMVDFRNSPENMEIFRQQLRNSGLEWIEEENITSNVVKAIEAEDASKKARIEKLIPKRWQKLFGEFAGIVGSPFYNTLKNGTRPYHRYVFRKV